MKKIIFLFALLLIAGFLFPESSYASLITVEKDGNIVWKVLSASDSIALSIPKPSVMEVKKVAQEGGTNEDIYLTKTDNKINLLVGQGENLDVTNWNENIIEVEERGDIKKISIFLKDNKFNFAQGNLLASTDYPIKVNPKENKFFLSTSSGEKYLAILPYEAAQSALRSRILDKIKNTPMKISEYNNDLCYEILGEKIIKLFNLYDLKTDIEAKVSASTGEIVFSNQPPWLRILEILFS